MTQTNYVFAQGHTAHSESYEPAAASIPTSNATQLDPSLGRWNILLQAKSHFLHLLQQWVPEEQGAAECYRIKNHKKTSGAKKSFTNNARKVAWKNIMKILGHPQALLNQETTLDNKA